METFIKNDEHFVSRIPFVPKFHERNSKNSNSSQIVWIEEPIHLGCTRVNAYLVVNGVKDKYIIGSSECEICTEIYQQIYSKKNEK
jgi:hypothetical protein